MKFFFSFFLVIVTAGSPLNAKNKCQTTKNPQTSLIAPSMYATKRRVYEVGTKHGQLCMRWDQTIGMTTKVHDIRGTIHYVCAKLDRDRSGFGDGDYIGDCYSSHR